MVHRIALHRIASHRIASEVAREATNLAKEDAKGSWMKVGSMHITPEVGHDHHG
jgi:hypothetical protein